MLYHLYQWLQGVFLPWLDDWEKQVKDRKDIKGKQKKKLLLSDETKFGIKMTGKYNE